VIDGRQRGSPFVEYNTMARRHHWLRTYIETAANRNPEQLFGTLRRKAEDAILPRLPLDIDAYYERRVPDGLECQCDPLRTNSARLRAAIGNERLSMYREAAREAAKGRVTFLSEPYRFQDDGTIRWHGGPLRCEPLLWWLKLQGFEHFAWPVLGYDHITSAPAEVRAGYEQWFESWGNDHTIADEPGYLRRDWIPHSVSLRILHWGRYLAWADDTIDHDVREAMIHQVAKNAAFLADHVEYDIGGNHLVENAVALVTAGVITGTDRLVDRGVSIFERTTNTQFLSDGGHFERSPMYHTIVTTRFLTAIDLLELSGRSVPSQLRSTTAKALGFLDQLRPPDGRIPLFHDSVYGEALSLSACLEYGEGVGVEARTPRGGGNKDSKRSSELPESGYYLLGGPADAMLCAGGPIADPSLPAHAHVHPGHVSLYLEERPMLTDSGTYTYASGKRRTRARSIGGHNTVRVADTEPVAIAGSFLMGDPVVPRASLHEGTVTALSTRYETEFDHAYSHRRDVFYADNWWFVWDAVDIDEAVPTQARYQCHPDISVDSSDSPGYRLQHECGTQCDLLPIGATECDIDVSEYYPRFGVAKDCQVVQVSSEAARSHRFGCFITAVSDSAPNVAEDPPAVAMVEERPSTLRLDHREYDLPHPVIKD
jgi:uncharacterized heparinase superfamily protein